MKKVILLLGCTFLFGLSAFAAQKSLPEERDMGIYVYVPVLQEAASSIHSDEHGNEVFNGANGVTVTYAVPVRRVKDDSFDPSHSSQVDELMKSVYIPIKGAKAEIVSITEWEEKPLPNGKKPTIKQSPSQQPGIMYAYVPVAQAASSMHVEKDGTRVYHGMTEQITVYAVPVERVRIDTPPVREGYTPSDVDEEDYITEMYIPIKGAEPEIVSVERRRTPPSVEPAETSQGQKATVEQNLKKKLKKGKLLPPVQLDEPALPRVQLDEPDFGN